MGQVHMAETKHELVWTIGKSLPASTSEVSLSATVWFNLAVPHTARDDPFCTGLNSFVSIDFVMSQATLSGIVVDVANAKVDVLPAKTKLKAATSIQLSVGQYLIWNSLGKARVCATYPTF